jgi:hypothetical protein
MLQKVDGKVIDWIKENLSVTHADVPLEYVREWTRRTAFDGRVQQYTMFGYLQNCIADGIGINAINSGVPAYLEEFEAKLSLRLFQELAGVQLPGIPMFRTVGQQKLAEIFRVEESGDITSRHLDHRIPVLVRRQN